MRGTVVENTKHNLLVSAAFCRNGSEHVEVSFTQPAHGSGSVMSNTELCVCVEPLSPL